MKKFLALVLALSMMLSCVAFAEEVASEPANTLVVGNSEMNGDFIDGFGSNSYDVAIKDLLMRWCSTYETTSAGQLVVNTQAVENLDITEDEAGNKIYTFTLCQDMLWSDGTPITAKDYVASYLWKASDEWVTAGASSSTGEGLLGYSAYLAGETDVFAGVKLIDDYSFSVTIDAEYLPYYFEYTYAAVQPIPAHVWVAGAEIVSTEEGSSFGEFDRSLRPVHLRFLRESDCYCKAQSELQGRSGRQQAHHRVRCAEGCSHRYRL